MATLDRSPDCPAGRIIKDRISDSFGEPAPAELHRKFEAMDFYHQKTEETKLVDLRGSGPCTFFPAPDPERIR
jgi:hypothetical protein